MALLFSFYGCASDPQTQQQIDQGLRDAAGAAQLGFTIYSTVEDHK
jgi:hypothetical protein